MMLPRLLSVVAITLAVCFAPGSLARAQDLSGAINAGPIIADGDIGAGGWLDLWAAFDWFRIGGFTGALTIPSSRDSHDRFATPAGVSIAAIVNLGVADLDLRGRAGIWGGSTQEAKMTAGGFVGGAMMIDFHLGGGASLGGGIEVWGFFGSGETWAVAPTLTLTFGPVPRASSAALPGDTGGSANPP